jgi:hypothetical protein
MLSHKIPAGPQEIINDAGEQASAAAEIEENPCPITVETRHMKPKAVWQAHHKYKVDHPLDCFGSNLRNLRTALRDQ